MFTFCTSHKFTAWVTLIASVFLLNTSGIHYLFGTYSSELKDRLGFSNEEIQTIGTCQNIGTWFAVLGGLILDSVHRVRFVLLLGCFLVWSGWTLFYLLVKGIIGPLSYYVVALFSLMIGQGAGWIYAIALQVNSRNFVEKDRGKIFGILLCNLALSSGFFSILFDSFFDRNLENFFLFLACLLPSVILIATTFTNNIHDPVSCEHNPTKLKKMIYASLGMIMYLSGCALIVKIWNVDPEPFGIGAIVLILSYIFIPYPEIIVNEVHDDSNDFLLEDRAPPDYVAEIEISLFEAWNMKEEWLLFLIYFGAIGTGVTILNNYSEIIISLEPDLQNGESIKVEDLPHRNDILSILTLFSVCNSIGRLCLGFLTDLIDKKVQKTKLLIILCFTTMCVPLYMSFSSIEMLYGSVLVHGFSFGGIFCLVPILVSEFFGTVHLASHIGFLGLAPSISTQLFSSFLAGKLSDYYQDEALVTITSSDSSSDHCLGRSCYQITLWCLCGLSFVSFLGAIGLDRLRVKKQEQKEAVW